MEGKFKLEWTDFEQNLVASFHQLRRDNELFDVTLVCEDEQVEAHKVILSASGGFFKSIMKKNSHSHPLIYMKGVRIGDMRALLDFMYLGQASVCQDNVKSLLRLGEELRVIGMVEGLEEGNKGQNLVPKDSLTDIEYPQNLEVKLEDKSSYETEETVANFKEIVQEDSTETEQNTTELPDSFRTKNNKTSKSGRKVGFECDKCDKFYKAKQNLDRHAETHIEGLAYNCKGCEKVFKTKNSLQFHMYTKCRSNRISN